MKRIYLIILVCVCATLPSVAQKSGNHNAEIARNLETFNDIYKMLDLYYVDSLSADTTIQWAIKSMLAQVDPFTQYYPQDDQELRQMATGKYAGIGSIIRYNRKAKRAMIIEPYLGTPSQVAGVKAGDIILTIDGVDVEGKGTPEVSNMLRGEAGTTFELKVRRVGHEEPLTFMLTRKTIQQPDIPYYGMLGDGVGYIYQTGFTDGVSNQMRQALVEMKGQGMTRLLLDLRGNPGGSMNEALEIVNLFVPKGRKVMFTKGKSASSVRDFYTSSAPLDTVMPIVVMVDGGSASASEIVSGSLQDMDRAVVLGARTYGKGLVQSVRDLPYRGNLKITTARYYIPSGRCVQAYDYRHRNADGSEGVVPDSLTRVFHTMNGREVRDGGGIKPDVVVTPDSLPTFLYDLVESDEFLEYCTRYAQKYNEIAPAGSFEIADADYDEFVEYMKGSGFVANRRSDEVFKLLKDVAQHEGYYDDAKEEFEALGKKFTNDLAVDLQRMKSQIKRYLADEIVGRYYYQTGIAQQQLVGDKCVDKALELLSNPEEMNKILGR